MTDNYDHGETTKYRYEDGGLLEEETVRRASHAALALREAQVVLHRLLARESYEKLDTETTERWIFEVRGLVGDIESCFNLKAIMTSGEPPDGEPIGEHTIGVCPLTD